MQCTSRLAGARLVHADSATQALETLIANAQVTHDEQLQLDQHAKHLSASPLLRW